MGAARQTPEFGEWHLVASTGQRHPSPQRFGITPEKDFIIHHVPPLRGMKLPSWDEYDPLNTPESRHHHPIP